MIVLKIYDKDLNFLGVIDDFISLIWNRKYYEVGNFELHLPLSSTNLKLIKLGNIINKNHNNENHHEAGVIEYFEINEDKNNNKIVVKGRFLSSYFDRRLIKRTFNFSGTSENAMISLINHCTPIPKLQTRQLKGFKEQINFQATMKNLLNILVKICKTSNLGFKVTPNFEEKKMYFEVYKGIDRTVEQKENNYVIFSENYDNLNNPRYSISDIDFKTVATVCGGNENNKKCVTVGEAEGLELREVFIEANDINSNDLSNLQYEKALIQRGLETLTTHKLVETFEFDTEVNMNFKYRLNYDLGDLVTVEKRSWGISLSKRITEVLEVYENGGVKITPTLGDPLAQVEDWRE